MLNKLVSALKNNKVTLVAVSKNQAPGRILELYNRGQRDFGENRVQEMLDKHESLPGDIRWHLIGHLQTNKVKYIAPFVHLIHAVDSLKLLLEINRQAQKYGRVVNCLLQFHVAQEETKFGMELPEARALLDYCAQHPLLNVSLCGVMGMATQTEDLDQVRREFQQLRQIRDMLKADYFPADPGFREISMGMSGDWEIAVEEGSTMVRIGSLLFEGNRL